MGQLRLLADLDEKLVKDFKKTLIDDETNYKEWLIRQIQQYLKKKGGKKVIVIYRVARLQ